MIYCLTFALNFPLCGEYVTTYISWYIVFHEYHNLPNIAHFEAILQKEVTY